MLYLYFIIIGTKAADSMDIYAINPRKAIVRQELLKQGKDITDLPQPTSLSSITKTIEDSYISVLLPFGTDIEFRNAYINRWGQLRVGKLLEEIDAFAGIIAYLHCDDNNPSTGPLTLVTASLDRLDLLTYPLLPNINYYLKGAVTYSGTSSMNIDVDLSAIPNNHPDVHKLQTTHNLQPNSNTTTITTNNTTLSSSSSSSELIPVIQASMTFVARNKDNQSVPVPRIIPKNTFETKLFNIGHNATEQRKISRKTSLYRLPPTTTELQLVHALFMELESMGLRNIVNLSPTSSTSSSSSSSIPSNIRFVSDTKTTTTIITMPQDRNIHGKVFGGYLMRKAFEIAFACGWKFTGVLPKFLALDDVTFLLPVETGTLLTFEARVTYARGHPNKTYSISVAAFMETPNNNNNATITSNSIPKQQQQLTNEFNFVFYCDDSAHVPRIYPRTYAEAMDYIHAYRRQRIGQKLAEDRKKEGTKVRFE